MWISSSVSLRPTIEYPVATFIYYGHMISIRTHVISSLTHCYVLQIAQTTDIYGYYGYDLGVQSSAKFMNDEASGVTISYTSVDQYR